uniref:Uncharacterized protein n=1 Tax=Ditylenchus dipsaci TaxID=166011 RepID=A0A915CYI4_9BILA
MQDDDNNVRYGPPNYNQVERDPYQAIPLALPAPESFGTAPFAGSSSENAVSGGQFNETPFRSRLGNQGRV